MITMRGCKAMVAFLYMYTMLGCVFVGLQLVYGNVTLKQDDKGCEQHMEFLVGTGIGASCGFMRIVVLWYALYVVYVLFPPEKVPWVYGRGGRARFTGLMRPFGNTVYDTVSGFRSNTDEMIKLMEIQMAHNKSINNGGYNEECYASPYSPLFLGKNMDIELFMDAYKKNKLNEDSFVGGFGASHDGNGGEFEREWKLGWRPGSMRLAVLANVVAMVMGEMIYLALRRVAGSGTWRCEWGITNFALGNLIGSVIGVVVMRWVPIGPSARLA